MNGKRSLASYKPIGCRISETVRRHHLDAEEVGEQKRMKGSHSNYNSSTYDSINQSQMALVSSVNTWDGHHRVISGQTAKRKYPEDGTDVGSLWHLPGDSKASLDNLTPPGQLRSRKKPRTYRTEHGIYNHLAQIKRKQATWYQVSNTKEFEAGQDLAIETASGMAQLRLACESVPGPTSTLCDQHEQTVPVISPRGNSSEGSRWLDGKCSMVSRQLDEKCVHNGQVASHRPLHAEMIGTASRGLNETTKRVERVKRLFSLFGQGHGSPREATEALWDSSSQVEFWRKHEMDFSRLSTPSFPASISPTMAPPAHSHDNKLGIVDSLAAVVPSIGTNSPTRMSTLGSDSTRGPALTLPTIYELELRSKVDEGVVCAKTTSIWGAQGSSVPLSLVKSGPHPALKFVAGEE